MIKKLRIRNFRSISDSKELSFGALNVIVGPNNAGKSSLLYSALLLKQTLMDKDPNAVLVTSGPYIDLGSYLDLVKADAASQDISILFELDESKLSQMKILDLVSQRHRSLRPYNRFELSFGYNNELNTIVLNQFKASDTKTADFFGGKRKKGTWQLIGPPSETIPHIRTRFEHFLPMIQPRVRRPNGDATANQVINLMFASRVRTTALNDFFEHLLYVGPIREIIPRYGFMGTQSYSELTPSGQNLMRVLASRQLRGKAKKTVLEQLNYWLDTKFRILRNVRILDIDKAKTIKAIVADDPRGDKNINLAAMGTGLSQLVPVVVQTVLTPKDGCILIEQPEIHLHPKAQAALGDLFVQHAKQGRQIIVETHSEHLLLRIRRRIAESRINPSLVQVFFVDKLRNQTRIRQLSVGKGGHFKRWPAGFFEEGYREAMALAMAQTGKAR